MNSLLIAVPALPLAGALIVALTGWKLRGLSHWPIVLTLAASFLCSLGVLNHVREQVAANKELSAGDAAKTVGYEMIVPIWTWLDIPDAYQPTTPLVPSKDVAAVSPKSVPLHVDIVLRADALTAIMLCMVTFISTLVAIYAAGYMHGDRSYWRFFVYIGLFVFSMTMLVSVSNFVLLFCFWEAVGACSYLLIGFWYQKPEAAAAGKKAFLVNRIGDFGLILGLFLIWTNYGTLDYHDPIVITDAQTSVMSFSTPVAGVLGQTRLANPDLFVHGGVAVAICALLFVGCCGKSAQFPLHVWLPDAMEGPTPVSALIHAATMVTAGVYLVTRCTPLFMAAGAEPLFMVGEAPFTAQMLVSVIGGFTALLAGLIALTQTDLKRVLAYSTVSQLGYMFLSLGTGSSLGIVAGMFHLFTHAFFKALLFLGSGSVMHAMGHVIDMRQFSGLRKIMPITHVTFMIGCLALAGLFPLAGFWSKDEILASLHERSHASHAEHVSLPQVTQPLVINKADGYQPVALLAEDHTHEHTHAPQNTAFDTTFSHRLYGFLYYLALGCAGLTAFYTFRAFYMTFYGELKVPAVAGDHAHESPASMTTPLIILAVCSVFVGLVFGYPTHAFSNLLTQTPSLAYSTIAATEVAPEFHMDVAFWGTAVALIGVALASYFYLGDCKEITAIAKAAGPLYNLSLGKFFIDQVYLIVFVFPLLVLAYLCYAVDRFLIDGAVNMVGAIPVAGGKTMRLLQNGMVQFYALAMVLGLIVLVWGIAIYGG